MSNGIQAKHGHLTPQVQPPAACRMSAATPSLPRCATYSQKGHPFIGHCGSSPWVYLPGITTPGVPTVAIIHRRRSNVHHLLGLRHPGLRGHFCAPLNHSVVACEEPVCKVRDSRAIMKVEGGDPLLGRTRIPARADAKAAACQCHVGMKRGSQGKTPWPPHLYSASGTAGRGGWGRPEVRAQPWPQPSRREGSVGRQRHQPALLPAGGPGLQNRADFRQDKGRGHDPRPASIGCRKGQYPLLT